MVLYKLNFLRNLLTVLIDIIRVMKRSGYSFVSGAPAGWEMFLCHPRQTPTTNRFIFIHPAVSSRITYFVLDIYTGNSGLIHIINACNRYIISFMCKDTALKTEKRDKWCNSMFFLPGTKLYNFWPNQNCPYALQNLNTMLNPFTTMCVLSAQK